MVQKRRPFGQVYERDGRRGWYFEFKRGGQRVIRHGGATREQAARKLRDIRVQVENRGRSVEEALSRVLGEFYGPDLTFADAVEPYLESARKTKRASTIQADETRLNVLARARWAKQPLGLITTADIARWLERSSLSPASRNRYRAAAGALFRWALVQAVKAVGFNTDSAAKTRAPRK